MADTPAHTMTPAHTVPRTANCPPAHGVSIDCANLQQSASVAAALSGWLGRGDVVLLDGCLAAGKTTFVALACHALGCLDQPSSPTYAISNVYACPRFDIFHIDAYRLGGVDEFLQLGLEEFLADSVTFIEWGARVAPAFACHLAIEIGFGTFAQNGHEEGRTYRVRGLGARWASVIAALTTHDTRSPPTQGPRTA